MQTAMSMNSMMYINLGVFICDTVKNWSKWNVKNQSVSLMQLVIMTCDAYIYTIDWACDQ